MSTQPQIAKHLDITTRRVRDLLADGVLPKAGARGLDVSACRIAYIRYLRAAKNKSLQSIGDEKVGLIREQRIAQQMKNEQARGELAPYSLIGWTLSKVSSQIAAILDAIPLRIKTIAPRLTAPEIEQIRREIIRCQNVAAAVDVDLAEYYETHPEQLEDHSR